MPSETRLCSAGEGSAMLRATVVGRVVSLALLVAIVHGCGDEPPPVQEVIRPVKIVEVGGQRDARREYPGRIRAAQYSEMAFEVPGRISELPLKEGDRVKRGQVVARLDSRDYQAKLAAAEAKLAQAASERDRSRILYEKQVSPQVEYERRARHHDVAAAETRQARKALEDTVLRAPFDGVLARRLVTDFRNVQAKEPVVVVQDDSGFEIKIAVPERDLTGPAGRRPSPDEMTRRLRPRVALSALPGQEFPARLTELAEVAEPTTRTFEATFAFARPERANVLGGMTAKLIVDVPSRSGDGGTAVPAASVVSDSAPAPYVWVVDPETMTVAKRTVELGALSGSEVRVSAGLESGDLVVASGVHQLREGAVVRRLER
jgi:RND family efflux transporter MFP subunit